MPLVATRGAASAQGFGEFAQSAAPVYIEDVFSTWLYTGTSAPQTITNGIDLAGKGGLVTTKVRSTTGAMLWQDTANGVNTYLRSDSTAALATGVSGVTNFGSTGFSLDLNNNTSAYTYASWTFRKQPKFFDVVTYTGTGSVQNIPHNLGSVPGCIIVKTVNAVSNWVVYHRSYGGTYRGVLNTTTTFGLNSTMWNNTDPTSTVFTVGTNADTNTAGNTYVAYIFAHDAGGFGLTGTDNVISCGSFTYSGSTVSVNLGYEPQWLLVKASSTTGDWQLFDNMRGMPVDGVDAMLRPNLSNAEVATDDRIQINATGFTATANLGTAPDAFIYIAIRRGPMKTPTSGTSVFAPQATAGATDGTPNSNRFTSNFPIDLFITAWRAGSSSAQQFQDRLRSPSQVLISSSTAAETGGNAARLDDMDGVYFTTTVGANSNIGSWMFRRAPGFFDEVCYTGTGSARTVTHNLGVAPELMIVKSRSSGTLDWLVYSAPTGNANALLLNTTDASFASTSWGNTTPTASVFSTGTSGGTNNSGATFVAYLFASCPGVSKVGSYTGNDATPRFINCGFTGGARFVLLKCTSQSSDWYVWDSARGLTSTTAPYLALNSTAAETASTYIEATAGGFTLKAFNSAGDQFIYLAIA